MAHTHDAEGEDLAGFARPDAMSLDPAASPWPGVFASVAVCLWIAAIGAPIAYAVFRHRPRLVWPFYAPIVGVAVVLLVTNLAAYVAPGAPAAWFGLLVPSALGAVIVRRGSGLHPLPRGSKIALLTMVALAIGVFALAYANRMHGSGDAPAWHYALAHTMAGGVFPPVTPYGVDAGPGYHYGADLLAASMISTTGALPWTALDAVASLLVVALVLAVAGFAYDLGTPLALALGLGAAAGFFDGGVFIGYRTGYIEGLAFLEPPTYPQRAFAWISWLQRPLAVGLVVLVAAALHAGAVRRQAVLLAAGSGVFALGDASVMIFASAALALVGTVRLIRLHGRERLVFAGALLVSALLVALAGGPVSDAIFDRGGTAGLVHVAFDPVPRQLLLAQPSGPALVGIGIIPLTAIGAIAAYRRRSWGLGFLAAASAFGLVEAALLQSQLEWHDQRIYWLALAVAMIGALVGLGALVGALRGAGRRHLAMAAVGLLVLLPTGLPRAVAGAHVALRDLEVVDPVADASGHHYRDRTFFGEHLEANWEFYAWLKRSLPTEARLLTSLEHAPVSAAAAGVASPLSHRDYQMFLFGYTTWVYEDALRFLHRDDLAEMGITHLHVTDALAANLEPSAKRLLDDPGQFNLLVDMHTPSGMRHRVFEVLPGAGTTEVAPSSYRALRQLVPPKASVSVLAGLMHAQRMIVMSAFADHESLQSSIPLRFERATRIPQVDMLADPPDRGVVILPEPLEPTALGLGRDVPVWVGHGARAYDLGAAWSPVGRIGPARSALPGPLQAVCASADGQVDLHLLGEPGTKVTAGSSELILTGLPQVVQLAVLDCGALTLSADSGVAPFAQIRPHHTGTPAERDAPIAGLGFDGGVDGERAIINLWYRNPHGISFTTGTEFRLYEASPLGVGLRPDTSTNQRTASLRWWPGPVALQSPEQIARIEFDARRLEINGDSGGGAVDSLTPGQTYLLALTVAGTDTRYGLVEIQHIVPLARVVVGETGVNYEVLTGIVTIEHHAPGTILQRTGYDGGLPRDAILTRP